jgi:hypothetical protein
LADGYNHPYAYPYTFADSHLDPIAHPHAMVDGNTNVCPAADRHVYTFQHPRPHLVHQYVNADPITIGDPHAGAAHQQSDANRQRVAVAHLHTDAHLHTYASSDSY